MKKLICLLINIFVVISGYSMYPIIQNFTRDVYHASSQNWDFTQNDGGCAYFANNGGLLEYNGSDWSLYPIANFTSVRSVLYDKETNRIYAGASNEFGYYEYTSTGRLHYTSIIDLNLVDWNAIGEVWHIHQSKGITYFQGDYNIYEYTNDKQLKRIPFSHKIDCSALIKGALIVCVQGKEPVIQSGDIQIKLTNVEILADKKISAVLPYQENKILFVTESHGIYIYNNNKLSYFPTKVDKFLKQNRIFSATTNGESLAFGTILNGLVLIESNGEIMYSNVNSGMQNNTILNLKFDRNNNLWMCLDKGIDYAITNSPETSLLGAKSIIGAGYASILYKNRLYLGTNQGAYYMDVSQNKFDMQSHPHLIDGLQGQVWGLKLIDDNLFCAHNNGLFIIQDTRIKKVSGVNGVWNIIQLKKHPQYLLGCSYSGLFMLKKVKQEWVYSHHLDNFNEVGGQFIEDNQGYIWFHHWIKGLFRLTLNEKGNNIINQEYFGVNKGLPSDHQNIGYNWENQLIFSSESGYYFFDITKNRMAPYPPLNNLFDGFRFSTSIHVSPNKDAFFISGDYFAIATPDSKNSYKIDSVSLKYMTNKLVKGFEHINFVSNGLAIISTEDGFSFINFDKLKNKRNKVTQSQVFINSIYSTNHQDSLIYGQRSAIALSKEYAIPYTNNSLRFEYISPHFKGGNTIEYSYFLENYDLEWSKYSFANTKEYTKLSEGSYVLKLKAKNLVDGQITDYQFPFRILPPWYRSIWAYIGYFLITVLLIRKITLFIQKLSDRKYVKLKKEKEEEIEKQKKDFEHQTLEHNLRHKAQELANSTLNLARKNEVFIKIKDDLENIRLNMNGSSKIEHVKKQIATVSKEIENNVGSDTDWFRFEENFDLVYEDFLKRLSQIYPQLNTNNKRLCAYIKMNLSSKDIASILNISVKSVEMARYRLRQKMELDSNINLAEYLQSI